MATDIALPFGNGVYLFRLGLAQIHELQSKTGDGIGAIYARVLQGRIGERAEDGHPGLAAYRIDDVRETVRQGLIGGGSGRVDDADVIVTALRAVELIETYLDPMPLADQWTLAAAILFAKIEGYDDPDAETAPADDKKKEGGLTTPPP